MSKILVTPRSLSAGGHPALERLRQAGFEVLLPFPGRQPTEEELAEVLPDCEGYLAGVEKISARVLESARRLRVISRNGTGIDNIDVKKAEELGIRICITEGANARGVAELTMGHLLAAARWISTADSLLKEHEWERKKGFELEGKTLGLIGCGKVGRIVARLALGFDLQVLAYDPYPDDTFRPSPSFRYVSLEDLLAEADIISLHCPAPEGGKPVIDAQTVSRMKPGAFLINTARAALIDEAAVLQGLETGRIAAVTVDAYRVEPPADWSLVTHPKVLATPHIGAYTDESVDRASRMAVDNLLSVLRADQPGS